MKDKILQILKVEPGLTAKELANRLGTTRKKVNQFFSFNSTLFTKDENYFWYIKDIDKDSLEFPSNIWLTPEIFEECLCNCGCLHSSHKKNVYVLIPEGCQILLNAGARLLSLINQLSYTGKEVTLDFIKSSKTKNYLNRAGFFDLLDKNVTVLPKRPRISASQIYKNNNSALVEFGEINPESPDSKIPKKLKESFVSHTDPSYGIDAFTVFSELFGNVIEHSNTKTAGFAALQKYDYPKKHIQTVVSDNGDGISGTLKPSLKKYYHDLYEMLDMSDVQTDIDLIIKAFSEGRLSKHGSDPEKGRGLGLFRSNKSAMKYNSKLFIRQETFSLELKFRNGALYQSLQKTGLPKIFGTQICFDFIVD